MAGVVCATDVPLFLFRGLIRRKIKTGFLSSSSHDEQALFLLPGRFGLMPEFIHCLPVRALRLKAGQSLIDQTAESSLLPMTY